jgi:hypothetical protein
MRRSDGREQAQGQGRGMGIATAVGVPAAATISLSHCPGVWVRRDEGGWSAEGGRRVGPRKARKDAKDARCVGPRKPRKDAKDAEGGCGKVWNALGQGENWVLGLASLTPGGIGGMICPGELLIGGARQVGRVGIYPILADPWSKEWGQPHMAAETRRRSTPMVCDTE